MKGTCALTQKETELKLSHIYPKFVIEWMKETGSTYLRRVVTPNRRQQDGYKIPLLGEEAEQLFSIREKWFAEKIFRPYLNNSTITIDYNENLYYFALSMLWRILTLELRNPAISDFKHYQTMLNAEKQWRDFLYKDIYPIDFDNVHIFITDRFHSHDYNMDGVEYYFCRQLDGTTIFANENNKCVVYAKFSRFFFFGILRGWDSNPLIGLKINPIRGVISATGQSTIIESFFGSFFKNRINLVNSMEKASDFQQEKILNEIRKNKEVFEASEVWEIIEKDRHN